MTRSPWMRRWSIDQRRPSTAERSHDVVSSRSRACSSACALRVDDCGRHFLTMLVTAGAVGAPGVLILPLQKEFGWQNAEISSAIGIRFLLFGLMAPFAAALINRFGMRRIALSALLLIAAGLLLSLAMTRVWQLVLLWGVVIGLGT